MKEITKIKLEQYFNITKEAIEKVKIVSPTKTPLFSIANDFLDMSKRYYSDAQHFEKEGDYVLAYGALNYAHGWLDAGARIGLFDVGHDSRLFTVD